MTKAWVVRPKPHGILRITEFLSGKLVALGWPLAPDLSGCDSQAIRQLLAKHYPDYSARELGQAAGTVNRFVNELQTGHIVVVPHGSEIHLGRIAGPYQYDGSKSSDDIGYPHQRPVSWLRNGDSVPRSQLPADLRNKLMGHQTVYPLDIVMVGPLLGPQSIPDGTAPQRLPDSPAAPQDQANLEPDLADEPVEIPVDPRRRVIYTDKSDPTVHDLFTRYKDGDLILQPGFQRQFVWDKKRCSRLIESTLLEVPLPIIYLAEDKEGKESVIDGQQRLTSFFDFLDSKFKLSGLQVLGELNGSTFRDLDKPLQARLKKYPLRVVTIKSESDENLQFEIFERLNTGSVALNDQELRNCIYRGPYNVLLHDLSKDSDFKHLLRIKEPDKRMRDVELVLRFAAFYHTSYLNYQPPMRRFLNLEMERYKNMSKADADELRRAFKNSLQIIRSMLDRHAFRRYYRGDSTTEPDGRWEDRRFNHSLYDVLMGVFAREDRNRAFRHLDALRESLLHLMCEDRQFIDAIELSTSAKEMVKLRFDKWRHAVEDIVSTTKIAPRCFWPRPASWRNSFSVACG